jgi:hypothetical protein
MRSPSAIELGQFYSVRLLIKTDAPALALEKKCIPANLHLKHPNTAVNWLNLPFKLLQLAMPGIKPHLVLLGLVALALVVIMLMSWFEKLIIYT